MSNETALAERRISPKAFTRHWLLTILAAIGVATLLFAVGQGLLSPLVLLGPAGLFAYARLKRAGCVYRLYPNRLEIESGILLRRIENVELFRVRDVGMRQGLLGRIANFGDVYVHSTDSSTPSLHVRGIDAPREFYQQMRDLITDNRGRNRTMIVEESRLEPEP